MKRVLRAAALLSIIAMCLGLLPVSALTSLPVKGGAVIDSGTCGANATWSIDGDYVLTISGTGAMKDYDYPVDYSTSNPTPWVFYRSRITAVVVEPGVTYIGENAFGKCAAVSAQLPDSVTEIGKNAFLSCDHLTDVTLPANIAKISEYMFQGCSALEHISIPNGVTLIDTAAFAGCFLLSEIDLPEGLTEIGRYAFNNCTALTSIHIPANVESIGDQAFINCTGVTEFTVDPANAKYSSVDGVLFTKYKTRLKNYPAANTRTSYAIPSTVTTVEDYAFAHAASLQSVSFPSGINKVGEWAFFSCTALTEVVIPDGLTKLSEDTFCRCTSLTSVTLPQTLTTIGRDAFSGCTSLEQISIPASVNSIDMGVFQDCTSLRSAVIPDGVTQLHSTFSGCTSLTDVTIPDSVKNLKGGTFMNCTSLESITLPEHLKGIYSGTFKGCSALKSIYIPDGVDYLGSFSFLDCTSLEEVHIPAALKGLNWGVFRGCTSLESIFIPDTIEQIGESAFADCTSLDNVVVPPKVKVIGLKAFHRCRSLTTVTLPYDITVKKEAFRGCNNLKTVNYPGSLAAWNDLTIETLNSYLVKAKKNTYYKYLNYCIPTIKYSSYGYTGNAIKPTVTVKTVNGTTLKKGTNYTVRYLNNTDFGTATIVLTGINNYPGELKLTFDIKPSKVKDLRQTAGTETSATVTWTASAGATKYKICRGAIYVDTVSSTTFTVSDMTPGRHKIWVYPIAERTDPETGKTVEYVGVGAYVYVNE